MRPLARITLLAILAVTTILSMHNASGDTGEKLNLLIIQSDEHNFRTLGCYRDTLSEEQALVWGKEAVVETPHIDWLADNGALCTRFYATTPVCSPSRASFVSGRYPQNTPVVTNGIPLDDRIVTFAEILRRRGYVTGYAGKWHLDGQSKPGWGPPRQFGFADNRFMFNRGHWKQLEQTPEGPRVKARTGKGPSYSVQGADETSFTTDFLADRTIEFLRENADKPFCYMLSLPDPHGPDSVRPPYDTMYTDRGGQAPKTFDKPTDGLPSWGKPQGQFSDMAQYFGMVRCIDENVGRILEALRETDQLDRTIVVFTADHGDLRGEHHRQNKGVPYEGSAKIPLVIHAPGKIPAGTVVSEALGCVDFLPTILGLMDVPTVGTEEGRDASALLRTGKAPADWTDVAIFRGTGSKAEAGWLAAVSSRHKLIVSPNDEPWLFDLEEDPDELINVVADPAYRQVAAELAGELLEYGEKYNEPRMENDHVRETLSKLVAEKQ